MKKKIVAIFLFACLMAVLEYFGGKYDLEPGEPGYETYGGFGALCLLAVMPFLLLKSALLLPMFESFALILFSDIVIIFALAGLFYLIRLWCREARGAIRAMAVRKN